MRRTFARKLRRELFNMAREANLSKWRSIVNWLMASFRVSEVQDLRYISETLAHLPNSKLSGFLIEQAMLLASKQHTIDSDDQPVDLSFCFILKPYVSADEKGVFLVSFEKQLERILDAGMLSVVQARYHILFVPSWTGLFSPGLFKLTCFSGDNPIFVLPVHDYERSQVKRLGKHVVPLPFNAASWVNQDFFEEKCVERDVGCLMVANFSSFKRHWLLFKALKGLPTSVAAVCVGVPLGSRSAESIRREAEDYGVSDRVTIVENPSQEDLRLYFQRAKVFCALSYREGSFIAVAEALMSGTPVIMFKNAHIGTKSLITPEVGALVGSVSELREQVIGFMNFEGHDKVRDIARQSISARTNCQKLNNMLADWSRENDLKWTRDIETFYSMRLSFYYYDENAMKRLHNDYRYFEDHGINIKLT